MMVCSILIAVFSQRPSRQRKRNLLFCLFRDVLEGYSIGPYVIGVIMMGDMKMPIVHERPSALCKIGATGFIRI